MCWLKHEECILSCHVLSKCLRFLGSRTAPMLSKHQMHRHRYPFVRTSGSTEAFLVVLHLPLVNGEANHCRRESIEVEILAHILKTFLAAWVKHLSFLLI